MAIGLVSLTLGLTACSSGSSSEVAESTTVKETTVAETTVAETTTVEETTTAEETTTVEATTAEVSSDVTATALFEKVFALYSDDEFFPGMGGSATNPVDGKPGAADLTDKDTLTNQYYIPDGMVDNVDDVATFMHMMNANTFTGVVAHVNGVTSSEFNAAVKEKIQGTQWICGMPDVLVIAYIGDDYVLYAFGERELMETFSDKIAEAHADLVIEDTIDIAPEFDF